MKREGTVAATPYICSIGSLCSACVSAYRNQALMSCSSRSRARDEWLISCSTEQKYILTVLLLCFSYLETIPPPLSDVSSRCVFISCPGVDLKSPCYYLPSGIVGRCYSGCWRACPHSKIRRNQEWCGYTQTTESQTIDQSGWSMKELAVSISSWYRRCIYILDWCPKGLKTRYQHPHWQRNPEQPTLKAVVFLFSAVNATAGDRYFRGSKALLLLLEQTFIQLA